MSNQQSAQADQRRLSPWQLKPWWCQPWSIGMTGCSLIMLTWLVFHRVWLVALVALPVGAWMGFFLLLWPRLVMQQPGWPTVVGDRAEP